MVSVDLRNRKFNQAVQHPQMPSSGPEDNCFLKSTSEITIAPQTSALIPTKASNKMDVHANYMFYPILCHAASLTMEPGVYSVTPQGNRLNICAVNTTDQPITLPQDSYIGYAAEWTRFGDEETSRYYLQQDDSKVDKVIATITTEVHSERIKNKHISSMGVATDDPVQKLDLSGLPQEHQQEFKKMFQQHRVVLSKTAEDVGHCPVIPQDIKLVDDKQVASTPPYRMPENLKQVVYDYVDRLYRANVIR